MIPTLFDIQGNVLNFGDSVAVSTKNGLVIGKIVGILPKNIRIEFDTEKFKHAVGHSYKYGVKKNRTPSILAPPMNVVKLC